MEKLKIYFPFAFAKKADTLALIVNIVLHLVAGLFLGWLLSLTAGVSFLGILAWLVFGLLDLYIVAGIVLSLLDYFKIFK